MKNFLTLACLASIAVTRDVNVKPVGNEEPVEPDTSNFPDEWFEDDYRDACGDDDRCKSSSAERDDASPVEKSAELVAHFDPVFWRWWWWCLQNPRHCKLYRSYCKMRWNPSYTTTYPYGNFNVWQFGQYSPIFSWGWMRRMPYANSTYGFSINEDKWNGKDCCSAGKHL